MTDHIPGPWEARLYEDYGYSSKWVIYSVNSRICQVGNFQEDGMSEANARLIARAPDLLAENEALKARVQELEAETARSRGLLWFAWREFNTIRARDGAPDGVDSDWWDELTDLFATAIGEDARKPWLSPEAKAVLAAQAAAKGGGDE